MKFDKFASMKFAESAISIDDHVENQQIFQLNLVERNVFIF